MNAITYAMQFFENWECDFYILNVQKISEYVTDDLLADTTTGSVYEGIAMDNKKQINTLVKKMSKRYKSQAYSFHGLFDYDDFISAIDQATKFHAIDLIVMGTNGATGAKEKIFGSNTLQVIRNIECPTLTVPEHFEFAGIKSALFSTQHAEDFSSYGISVFKEILNMHQCELKVLEVGNDTEGAKVPVENKSLQVLFKDYPYTYFYLNAIPGLTAINTATQLLNVDLHAVFVEKETLLERLLYGSETSQLTYSSLIPLLFLHR